MIDPEKSNTFISSVNYSISPRIEDENDAIWLASSAKKYAVKMYGKENGQDVFHEALILFRRNRHATPWNGLIKKYLNEAARNLRIYMTIDELAVDIAGEDDPEEMAELSEIFGAVAAAIAKLSPRCQEIIQLRYFSGITIEATAKRFDMKMGEVYACECAAIGVLRRLLLAHAPWPRQTIADLGPLFSREKEAA
ncbi:MAG: sigma-70 family RNA polymerase sigma factor [Nitrospirae bacterium]|nr:sigma-70 family RNA polymerase sigma factor [Nitrospirota bacterium]